MIIQDGEKGWLVQNRFKNRILIEIGLENLLIQTYFSGISEINDLMQVVLWGQYRFIHPSFIQNCLKRAAGGIRTPGLLITNQPLYH
jgi:hypothetical protein